MTNDDYLNKCVLVNLLSISSEKSLFYYGRFIDNNISLGEVRKYITDYHKSNPKYIPNIRERAASLIKEMTEDESSTFKDKTKERFIGHLENYIRIIDQACKDRSKNTNEVRHIYGIYKWIYEIHHAWEKAKTRRESQEGYQEFLQEIEEQRKDRSQEMVSRELSRMYSHFKCHSSYSLPDQDTVTGIRNAFSPDRLRNKFQTTPLVKKEYDTLRLASYLYVSLARRRHPHLFESFTNHSITQFPEFGLNAHKGKSYFSVAINVGYICAPLTRKQRISPSSNSNAYYSN